MKDKPNMTAIIRIPQNPLVINLKLFLHLSKNTIIFVLTTI